MTIRNIIFAIDASFSMGKQFNDFRPNKLLASLEIVGRLSRIRIMNYGDRVGLLLFNAYVIPLLEPVENYETVAKTLAYANFVGGGSALGDAIIYAVKMLRRNPLRRGTVIVLSDGELNVGAPIELATLYARNAGVDLCLIIIGEKRRGGIREKLESLQRRGMLRWLEVLSVSEAEASINRCLGGQV